MIKYREVHIRRLRSEFSLLRTKFILRAVNLLLEKWVILYCSECNFEVFCSFIIFIDKINFDDMRDQTLRI
jgi:hypothetical protein